MGVIGFVRKIGDSGQIVLPKEFMEMHGWQNGMLVEIFFSTSERDRIILKKYRPGENLFGEKIKEIIDYSSIEAEKPEGQEKINVAHRTDRR